MFVSEVTEGNLTDELIDRILYKGISDTGEKGDCILVLGSIKATKYRVPVAANLYKVGRSDKIMLCGGAIRNFLEGEMTEAEHMYKGAIKLVSKEDIILENTSQNTVENFLCALVELQRTFWLNKIKSIILVTTTYHMRRSLEIARYFFPSHITIIPCPADDINTTRANWSKSLEGIERAKGEVINIVRCVKNGVIPDFEI